MSVTVLAIDSVEAEQDGVAAVRRFLNADTVGAQLVEGLAYELPPGGRLGPREAVERYEVLYVTSGHLTALFRRATHGLGPGQGVYCEPGEGCEVENTSGMPATFYRFFVKPA